MKLPDFTSDAGLEELRTKMGAERLGNFSTSYRAQTLTQEELDKLANEGIEVSFDQIIRLEDGTLAYKDSRVLVHIRDVSMFGGKVDLPRFHLAYCRTLNDMTQAKRSERYIVATRETGEFLIVKVGKGQPQRSSSWQRLKVCQNCLDLLSFDHFSLSLPRSKRHALVDEFSISRFFERYPRSLHTRIPKHTDISAPINDYNEDFSALSRLLKSRKKFTCEECRLGPIEPHLLQVHHINGQKNNDKEENLKVLCMECHAKQPYHGRVKAHWGFAEFQRKYRS